MKAGIKMKLEDVLNKGSMEDIYKKYDFFPGHLITEDEEDGIKITIGTGGDGKTFNELKEAIKIFQKGGLHNKSAFLYPTKAELEEVRDAKNLFDKLLGEKDSADEFGEFIKEIRVKGDWFYWRDEPFVRLYSLNQHARYKPQDHTGIGNIWMDEFQRERYLKKEGFKIQDLLSTIIRKREGVRIHFTSNAISLNSPLFLVLGIYELDLNNIVSLKKAKSGRTKAKVIYWKRPWEDVKKKNNDSIMLEIFDEGGYADYRYKNNFKNDNVNNIINLPTKEMEHIYRFEIEDLKIDIFYFETEKGESLYYVDQADKKQRKVQYYFHKNYFTDGLLDATEEGITDGLLAKVQRGLVYYRNIPVKQTILDALRFYA